MTQLFRTGQRVKLVLRGGQTVDATIVRPGTAKSLVSWGVNTYWAKPGDMGPPTTVTKWRRNSRMWDQAAVDQAQRDEADANRVLRRQLGNPAMCCGKTICCLGDGHEGACTQ